MKADHPISLDDLLGQKGKWLEGSGPLSDIAVSSRIRLARNVDAFPFPRRASPDQLKQIEAKAEDAIAKAARIRDITMFSMEALTLREKQFLVERHLMSQEHATALTGRALAIDPAEQISIMVNEEDHLRIQVLASGIHLREAWNVATMADDDLFASLSAAFSPTWGYLTYCPTNVGTGLRASIMLHLPALVFQRRAEKVLQGVTQLGLAVRGLYGESSEVRSVFFQLSNHVALGKSEEELIDHVERIARQVVEQEHDARRSLLKQSRAKIEDSVWRAYGLLRHARILSATEATDLLSAVRLGVEMGVLRDVAIGSLNDLLVLVQPAHTQRLFGMEMSASMRDTKRAELVRSKMGEGPAGPPKRRPKGPVQA